MDKERYVRFDIETSRTEWCRLYEEDTLLMDGKLKDLGEFIFKDNTEYIIKISDKSLSKMDKIKKIWGKWSLVSGLAGFALCLAPYIGIIFSICAIVFYGIQKSKTKET